MPRQTRHTSIWWRRSAEERWQPPESLTWRCLGPSLNVDFDASGRVLGIEVLGARVVFCVRTQSEQLRTSPDGMKLTASNPRMPARIAAECRLGRERVCDDGGAGDVLRHAL